MVPKAEVRAVFLWYLPSTVGAWPGAHSASTTAGERTVADFFTRSAVAVGGDVGCWMCTRIDRVRHRNNIHHGQHCNNYRGDWWRARSGA